MDRAKLLEDLLGASSANALGGIIETIYSAYGDRIKKVPVGGRENNLGNIAIGSDTGKGVVERLTNAIDAVIELEHNNHNGIPKCRSPQEAATSWLGVPGKVLYLECIYKVESCTNDTSHPRRKRRSFTYERDCGR